MEAGEDRAIFGAGQDRPFLWIGTMMPEFWAPAHTPASAPVHLAFRAPSREAVEMFHIRALAAGGADNGAPGPRTGVARYYAAFVLDPDGNNIEATLRE